MSDEPDKYEVRLIPGCRAVLMRRVSTGELVDEATFDSSLTARHVARILNEHDRQAA